MPFSPKDSRGFATVVSPTGATNSGLLTTSELLRSRALSNCHKPRLINIVTSVSSATIWANNLKKRLVVRFILALSHTVIALIETAKQEDN